MCGIAGFIDFNRSFSTEKMRVVTLKIIAAIQHRGPMIVVFGLMSKQG